MRKWTASRAVVVASALTLMVGSAFFGLQPSAAEASPAPGQIVQSRPEQLPRELTDAIVRDLRISPAEYLDRAARAQQLGTYAQDFRADRPDEFSGAWLDEDGHPIIAVTTDAAAQAAAEDGYLTKRTPISAADLERAAADLTGWVRSLPRAAALEINSIAIDVLNSQIVVDIANSPLGRALNLPTLIANVKVMLSPGGGGPVQRGPMGGDTYISAKTSLRDSALTEIAVCSFGFNSTDARGNALNISAGHCDPNIAEGTSGAAVYVPDLRDLPASPQVGTFFRSTLGDPATDGLDYSVIRLNDRASGTTLFGPAIRGANGTTLNITGTAEPVIGAPVCKSGQTSAFTCGVVAVERVEAELHTFEGQTRLARGFATTACTLAGDSGGAIVSGTLALGITSGSNAALAPSCQEANLSLAPDGGTATLGIPIRPILADIDRNSGGGVGSQINVRTAPTD
ncbi:MAG: protease [Aldersonia sp.]|nr:protease [Aldersonia sp.]